MNAKEFLHTALGGNMNFGTLKPLAIEEIMEQYARHKSQETCEAVVRLNDLLNAAISWWRQRRPCEWGEGSHLANPTINTTTDAEKILAKEVAKIVGI